MKPKRALPDNNANAVPYPSWATIESHVLSVGRSPGPAAARANGRDWCDLLAEMAGDDDKDKSGPGRAGGPAT